MANKYNCPEAYYNLYHVLTTKVRIDDIIMYSEDKFTKSLAKYYILKSYELGFRGAKIDVELLFGKTNIPRSCEFIVFTSDK